MKVEFVATRKNSDPSERELYEMDFMLGVLGYKRAFMDLGLQTVATCTPPGVEIRFQDEYLAPLRFETDADLVALSAKTSCVTRAYAVADAYRARGKRVVLGGIHASLRPEEALQHVDCVVVGEAEETWPRVIRDLEAGKLAQRYDAGGFPNMRGIPVPSWRFVDQGRYFYQQIQTTRGCPFMCRFCSVPDISGQDFRFKPVENVLAEIRGLPKSRGPIDKTRPMYVVDDNFISRPAYTRELLKAMAPLHARGELPSWSAETTLNVARDEELLDLLAAAGCTVLIIGFESVSEATLKDMDKGVNFCMSYQDATEAILSRGMNIVGNFIVGFDTDDLRVFADTLEFIQRNGILYPFFSILTPMPGTALFDEMKAAGRLDHERWDLYDTRHVVFEPKQMTREQLMDGYIWLYEKAYGAEMTLERLEKAWRRSPKSGSDLASKVFITARTAGSVFGREPEYRSFYKALRSLLFDKHLGGDVGQMLYMLDSNHFARFLRRFSTAQREVNQAIFADPIRGANLSSERSMQWDKVRRKRLARGLPVLAG